MSNWAEKYMKKQGWKETGGIGKTLQGRSEPVKVKYKFDGYGIGHDQAEHHKFKWWERAFETAAASIEVGDDNKIQKTGKGGPVVSTTMPISKALNKAMLYGRFIKRGVMKGGKVEAIAAPQDSESDSDSDSDDETTKKIKGAIVEISDAELFKRCGGLTGHKGARHGHTMNAKIDRLKASEEEGLKRLAEVRKQQEERKKKENLDQWEDKIYGSTEATSTEIKELKKKKKKNRLEEPVAEDINANTEEQASVTSEEPEETPKKKKKKKRKLEHEVEEESSLVVEEKPKKKKKKKVKEIEENSTIEEIEEVKDETVQEVETPKKKKKKKSKKTEEITEEITEPVTEEVVEEVTEKTKKKKKKKKKE